MPRTADLTDKQKAVVLALSDRTGTLITTELRDLVARAGMNDDDFPELDRPLTNAQIIAVGRQLERKGLVVESGYLNTERRWKITDEGRARANAIKGVI